jgi:hypothetical protein
MREKYHNPAADKLLLELNGSKYFSKIDFQSLCHQVQLYEESQVIMTFMTHLGLYRNTHLIFGASCALEPFQKVMVLMFQNCEGLSFSSMELHGTSKEEHNQRLEAMLRRIHKLNLTLIKDKCESGTGELTCGGQNATAQGFSTDDHNVKVVHE